MTRKGQLRLRDYIGHMLDAVSQIGRYVEDLSEDDFLKDRKTQDAVIRNFEILGEAARNIESAARNSPRLMPRSLGVRHTG